MVKKLPVYGMYRDVPPDVTYPSGWRQRGYKIAEGQEPIARLIYLLDAKTVNLPLYSLGQVVALRGKQAKRRRQAYISALHGYD